MTPEESDDNWLRLNCFIQAKKRYSYKSTEDLIEEAKKIERYVFNTPEGRVVYLKDKVKK